MQNNKPDPHDNVFADDLTEEREPSPVAREDTAQTQRMDPEDNDPEAARKLLKGQQDRSVL